MDLDVVGLTTRELIGRYYSYYSPHVFRVIRGTFPEENVKDMIDYLRLKHGIGTENIFAWSHFWSLLTRNEAAMSGLVHPTTREFESYHRANAHFIIDFYSMSGAYGPFVAIAQTYLAAPEPLDVGATASLDRMAKQILSKAVGYNPYTYHGLSNQDLDGVHMAKNESSSKAVTTSSPYAHPFLLDALSPGDAVLTDPLPLHELPKICNLSLPLPTPMPKDVSGSDRFQYAVQLKGSFFSHNAAQVEASLSSHHAANVEASLSSHSAASSPRWNGLVEEETDAPIPAVATSNPIPPTLPPSVEQAYKKKCIELKRRLNEVEESNDAFRLRKVRLERGIRKMRLERAFLLETLGKRMIKNGVGGGDVLDYYDEDSEGSSGGPPTV